MPRRCCATPVRVIPGSQKWSAGTCKYHVLRGGSWASEFRFLPDGVWIGDAVAYRAAVRGWETSVKARNSIGFRVARSLQ